VVRLPGLPRHDLHVRGPPGLRDPGVAPDRGRSGDRGEHGKHPRGEHRVLFNRATAASQAFSRKFPDIDEELAKAKEEGRPQELPDEALAWLSRGLLEQINGFIARAADATWALDIAIYEYELPAILDAVKAALDRGADVRIVFHAAPGDTQTEDNEKNLAGWAPEPLLARASSPPPRPHKHEPSIRPPSVLHFRRRA
jgi:hypothetical protein